MPRKPGPYFYVYTMVYASPEVKARIEAGGFAEMGDLAAIAQLAGSEYKAAQALFRACRAARLNPLAFQVLVERGQEVIIDVRMP